MGTSCLFTFGEGKQEGPEGPPDESSCDLSGLLHVCCVGLNLLRSDIKPHSQVAKAKVFRLTTRPEFASERPSTQHGLLE